MPADTKPAKCPRCKRRPAAWACHNCGSVVCSHCCHLKRADHVATCGRCALAFAVRRPARATPA